MMTDFNVDKFEKYVQKLTLADACAVALYCKYMLKKWNKILIKAQLEGDDDEDTYSEVNKWDLAKSIAMNEIDDRFYADFSNSKLPKYKNPPPPPPIPQKKPSAIL